MFEMEYLDDLPESGEVEWQSTAAMNGQATATNGSPHLSVAAFLLLAIGLKAFTESSLISTDLAEIKISLLNVASVFTLYAVGKILFLLATTAMVKRGFALPGQAELARVL